MRNICVLMDSSSPASSSSNVSSPFCNKPWNSGEASNLHTPTGIRALDPLTTTMEDDIQTLQECGRLEGMIRELAEQVRQCAASSATNFAEIKVIAAKITGQLRPACYASSVARSSNTSAHMSDIDVEGRRGDSSVPRNSGIFSEVLDPFTPARSLSQVLKPTDQLRENPVLAASQGIDSCPQREWDTKEDSDALHLGMERPGFGKHCDVELVGEDARLEMVFQDNNENVNRTVVDPYVPFGERSVWPRSLPLENVEEIGQEEFGNQFIQQGIPVLNQRKAGSRLRSLFSAQMFQPNGRPRRTTLMELKDLHYGVKVRVKWKSMFAYTKLLAVIGNAIRPLEGFGIFKLRRGVETPIGVVIGCYFFLDFQPTNVKDPVIRPLVEQDAKSLRCLVALWNGTFVCILSVCAFEGMINLGAQLHGLSIICGFEMDSTVGNTLLAMYSKCKMLNDAKRLFDAMSQPDVISGNALIPGYVQNDMMEAARFQFGEMASTSAKPDAVTFSSLLPSITDLVSLKKVKLLHGYIIRNGVPCYFVLKSALIDAYFKCRDANLAIRMSELTSNVVIYTAMVSGSVLNGLNRDAVSFFKKLLERKLAPSYVTVASLLPACAGLASLGLGKELHGYILRGGLDHICYVQGSIADMYAKCGQMGVALSIFTNMPDSVTFLAVNNACGHAGEIDEGIDYFYNMTDGYNIPGKIEHYVCIVDLFGRVGHVNETFAMIRSMPFPPDAGIRGTLLGASRLHGFVRELIKDQAANMYLRSKYLEVPILDPYNAANKPVGILIVKVISSREIGPLCETKAYRGHLICEEVFFRFPNGTLSTKTKTNSLVDKGN